MAPALVVLPTGERMALDCAATPADPLTRVLRDSDIRRETPESGQGLVHIPIAGMDFYVK